MIKKLHEIIEFRTRSGKGGFFYTVEEDKEENTLKIKSEIVYDLSKKSDINEIVRYMRKDKNPLFRKLFKIQYDHREAVKNGLKDKQFDDEYIDYIEKKKEEIDSKSK